MNIINIEISSKKREIALLEAHINLTKKGKQNKALADIAHFADLLKTR